MATYFSRDRLREEFSRRSAYFRDLSVRRFREPMLLLRTANTTKGAPARPIQVGDVCLLKEDNEPRVRWKLVRVPESHEGRDGEVRVYTVEFPNRRLSKRASQLLYPLKVGPDQSLSPPTHQARCKLIRSQVCSILFGCENDYIPKADCFYHRCSGPEDSFGNLKVMSFAI